MSLPLWQMFILRSSIVVPVLLWFARRKGPIAVTNIGWATLRSTLLVLMWLSYYSALPLMPLSLAAAAYYTGPLFIVALAAAVSRIWPSGRAILAIAAGFVGVLLVIRPDTSGVALGTLLPVAAAFLYACAMVLTSAKCREDDPFVLALALNITFIVSGAMLGLFSGQDGSFIFGPWQAIDLQLLTTVAALAVLILIGSVGAAIAYQKGPPNTVAAFDYSYLVFSLVWGGLFFAEFPNMIGLVGVLIIAAAGLLALPVSRQEKVKVNE
ncbi:DMT family transporter [Aestuariibius sp. 2305UL40-4]|uniref:DMT family transporter n=1 Tax=Aestuariibius violaceus TaxID=3234132 RepID=UPI00345EDF7E